MRFEYPSPDDSRREVAFCPAEPDRARTLTPAQVEAYNDRGFIRGLPALGPEEAMRAREYVDGLVESVLSAPDRRNSYSIVQYHLVCEGMYDLVTNPVLLDYVEDVIGPDIVCWGTQLFCKLPYDHREVPLHQDAVYWGLTPTRTVTVWLAIDDADEGNSAMQFVAGSHLAGALPHEDLELDGTRVLRRQVAGAAGYRDRVTNSLRAGEVSLHSDLLLHGSGPNRSGRRRAGLTLRYVAGEVRALPGFEWFFGSSVHCRGDIPDRWPDRARPTGEHPELMAGVTGEFDGTPADPP